MPVFVNRTEITDEQVFAEMQYHPAASANEAQYKAAVALTIRELLLQEADQLGIIVPDADSSQEIQDEFKINRLLEMEVATPEPDETTCQRYYDQNPKHFCDKESNPIPFAHAREAIAAYLKDVSWQTAVRQYIKVLAGKSKIAGIHLEGTDSPLVQ